MHEEKQIIAELLSHRPEPAMERFARLCKNYSENVPPTMHIFPQYHADDTLTVNIQAGTHPGMGEYMQSPFDLDAAVSRLCDRIDAAEDKKKGRTGNVKNQKETAD